MRRLGRATVSRILNLRTTGEGSIIRIAIGQISHETNTMFGEPTPVTEFQRQGWSFGDEIVHRSKGVRGYLGGMIDAAEELGIELVPTFAAQAHP
ncbi:MAG: M81 family metallopeptidase, partial [Chloroflexota bacterium]